MTARKKTYKDHLTSTQKWEQVTRTYKAQTDAMLKEDQERVRRGDVVVLDEPSEILRVYLLRQSILQQQEAARRTLEETGFAVTDDGHVSWNEMDERFRNDRFLAYAYFIIRQYQQTLEEIILLNMLVKAAQERGISQRFVILSITGVLRDFQLTIAPALEYNLLRLLHLEDVAVARVAGNASAGVSLIKAPRVKAALEKKRMEDNLGGSLRDILHGEMLSAIAELPHVGSQLELTPDGISRFMEFKNKVLRDLEAPLRRAQNEHSFSDEWEHHTARQGDEATGDLLEAVLAVEDADEYKRRYTKFWKLLSTQERLMVKVIEELKQENPDVKPHDRDIAERMGIGYSNIPNLRLRMAKKYKKASEQIISR